MKKLLAILGMTMLTVTSGMPVISCVNPHQELTIHEQIEKSLQKTITFDDDWITDYSQPTDKIEMWRFILVKQHWTLFNKLITNSVFEQLLKDIPDLLERYPDFSLSAAVMFDDMKNLVTPIENNKKAVFNYDVSYNLHQLQDIPVQDLLIRNNLLLGQKTALIKFFDGSAFGHYKIMGKDYQNKMVFNQKKFVKDDKKRLNYLAKMLNATTPIKAFDANYRKFLMMSKYIPSVEFDKTDFATENLIKEIHHDNNNYNVNKANILKNLKQSFIIDNRIKSIFKFMPIIFDDFDIDVSFVKAVLTSEIKDDEAMNYVYGSDIRTYYNDMLVVNVKTRLKMGNIMADFTIDEQLALEIHYV